MSKAPPSSCSISLCHVRLVAAAGLLLAPLLAHAQWQNGVRASHQAKYLHAAHAVFSSRADNDTNSLSALAQLRAHKQDTGAHDALLYATAGLPAQAEALISAPGNRAAAPAIWLQIAQTFYENGNYDGAERVLLRMPPQPPARAAHQRASLLARTLLQQQRYDEAALPLAVLEQFGEISAFDHFNLGIAWLGAGATARGAGELNTLGSYAGDEPPLRALADQANLTLGYWLLRNQRARQARRVLWRIPLNSPLARKALLALGWSEFLSTEFEQPLINVERKACERAPAVLWNNADPLHKVPRNNCRIPQVKNKKALLAAAPGYADTASQFERAAVAWQAAIRDGDPADPVVAEAMITLPYALVESGDLAQAQAAYQRAANALIAVDQALAQPGVTPDEPDNPQLTRLVDIQTSLGQLQAHLNARVTQLAAVPQNRNAQDVASILDNLRAQTPAGQPMAQPSPVERGRLLLALAEQQDSAAARLIDTQDTSRLQQRVDTLNARLEQTQAAVSNLRQQTQAQVTAQHRQQLRAYLRQASLAFADLAQDRPNQP